MDIVLGSKVRVVNGFYKGIEGIVSYRFSGEKDSIKICFLSNCGDYHTELIKVSDIEIV